MQVDAKEGRHLWGPSKSDLQERAHDQVDHWRSSYNRDKDSSDSIFLLPVLGGLGQEILAAIGDGDPRPDD
jgi:hypothetical protein